VPVAVVLLVNAVVLTSVNPAGIVSSMPHTGLAGRFELGVIVTTNVAPGATVAAGIDLVTLPALAVPTVTDVDAIVPVLVSESTNVPLMV